MTRRLPLRTFALAIFGALLALAAVACSSDDDAKVVEQSTASSVRSSDDDSTTTDDESAEPTDEGDGTDESIEPSGSRDLTLPDGIELSDVTCSNSGISLDDSEPAPEGEVDCTESHDSESIEITGASDLDDCYRAIASVSDLVIVVDEDDEFDLDDERVDGHSFGGYDDTYQCQISLAEARTEPLLDR